MKRQHADSIQTMPAIEAVLQRMAIRYIDLPLSEIDGAVEEDLGGIAKAVGVEHGVYNELLEDRNEFHPSYAWCHQLEQAAAQPVQSWFSPGGEGAFYRARRYLSDRWRRGESVACGSIEALPVAAENLRRLYARNNIRSFITVPVAIGGRTVGVIGLSSEKVRDHWPGELAHCLKRAGEMVARLMMRRRSEGIRRKALDWSRKLNDRIRADYLYLQEEIFEDYNTGEIIGQSQKLQAVLAQVRKVAPTDATVLVMGETGTGKELVARAIHQASHRRSRPLVRVNCTTLPAALIESELFGHERGAFTGAVSRRTGRFELADGATLFLDEIGDLPLALQPKLLRVLQDGAFERVGDERTIRTDVRLIAATNRDMAEEVAAGRFRQDLWYRLNVFPILLPPLRERREDIRPLINWFAGKISRRMGKKVSRVSRQTMQRLVAYDWPGNVRELQNLVERAVIISQNDQLIFASPSDPFFPSADRKGGGANKVAAGGRPPATEDDRSYCVRVLNAAGWVIEGPNGAACHMNMKPSTFRYHMRKLGITRPRLGRD